MTNRLTLLLLLQALVLSCSKNTPPVIENIFAEPDSVFPGDTVFLGFIVPFGTNEILHFDWSCASGRIIGPTFPAKTYAWNASVPPGEYFIKLKISIDELETTDSIKVIVLDTTGTFTDDRDGHQYKWVKIGSQFWMADNLAFLPSINADNSGSYLLPFYYVNFRGEVNLSDAKASEYYNIFGVLYNFEAAQTACPDGWHLPDEYEWRKLEQNLGMSRDDVMGNGMRNSGLVGGKLKEPGTAFWYEPNSGANNLSGFNALPGGTRSSLGGFHRLGLVAQFWTSTIYGMEEAWYRHLWYDNDGIGRGFTDQRDGHSVRCLTDE